MKKSTAFVALLSTFTVAICFIILGSISSELMAALGINEAQLGTLVMVAFLTMCIVQLFVGPMVDKFGYKPIAITGFIITGVSFLLLAVTSSFSMALFACILLGFGAMPLNTVGNTLIPVVLFEGKDPARASNFGNGFFGLGYVLTPLIIVLIIKTMGLSYKVALIFLAVLCFLFFIIALTSSFPNLQVGFTFDKASKVALKPAVLIAALALFCYMALEISMGTWVKSLMQELYGASGIADPATKAGLVLSLFGVAMMIGRFIVSGVKNLTAMGPKLITLASLLALIAILLMIFAKGPALGILAVMLAGLAFAPIFPTIVGVTFAKFDPSLYGSILGFVFSIGLLGGTLVPKFIGNVSVGSTVQQGLLIPAIMAAILLIISLFIGKIGKTN